MQKGGKERIDELDIMRGMAFLAVVLQHAIGAYIRRPEISLQEAAMLGILFNLAKFAVPTFVLITGIVLFYNYYQKIHYASFIRKRAVDILIPYLIWSGIYMYYYHGLPTFDWAGMKGLVKELLSGTAAYHLWFVVMIFQCYLVFPLYRWAAKRLEGKARMQFWTILITCGLAYGALMWFSAVYIPTRKLHFDSRLLQVFLIDYRDRNFLFYSFYFIVGGVAGLALYKWRAFIKSRAIWNGGLFLLLFLIVGQALFATGGVNLNQSTSLKPSMFLYTLCEIILLYGAARLIQAHHQRLFTVFSFIGNYSFGAYLVHAMVLNYVIAGLRKLVPWGSELGMTLLATLIAAAVSLAFTKVISLLPYGKYAIGPFGKRVRQTAKKPVSEAA